MLYKKRINQSKYLFFILALLIGCSSSSAQSIEISNNSLFEESATTVTPTNTFILTDSPTSLPTATLLSPKTPSETPLVGMNTLTIEDWIYHEKDEPIEVPILLYHHVKNDINVTRYNVFPEDFAMQMQALAKWQYTTIPISLLVEVIQEGGYLPPRPIVLTFDDGHLSVFENAFPIMNSLNLVGVNYVNASRFNTSGFVGLAELTEMIDQGWEIGSHTYNHVDLTIDHSVADFEIKQSRIDISNFLNIDVDTIAYPYGSYDPYIGDKVLVAGYEAGVGVGNLYSHSKYTRFYLSRIEIYGGWTLNEFANVLPWSGPITLP